MPVAARRQNGAMNPLWSGEITAKASGESAGELHVPPGDTHHATTAAAATAPGVIGYRPNKVGAGVPVAATEEAPELSGAEATPVSAAVTDSAVPEARQVNHFRSTGDV